MRSLDRRDQDHVSDFKDLLLERVVIALEEIEKLPVQLREPVLSPYWRKDAEDRESYRAG